MAELSSEPESQLTVEHLQEHSTPVVRLAGELDISTVDAARAVLDAIAASGDGIVFDVGEVTFMDSTGIAFLLAGLRRFGRVRLRQPPPLVRQIIEMTGLAGSLPVE